MDYFTYKNGTLFAEDVPVAEIAAAVGTPFYCYSKATLVRHARIFREALSSLTPAPLIAFAVKANSNLAVLKVLAQEGMGADVVSGGELRRALAAGIPPEKIIFSGVGKTDAELHLALDVGIGQINAESESELRRVARLAAARGVKAPVALRVNPDVDAHTHAKISTGQAENKFGIGWKRAEALYQEAAGLPGLAMQGLAAHIGSQLRTLQPFSEAWARLGGMLKRLRAAGCPVTRMDLGGGLGAPYDPALPLPPSPADYGKLVAEATKDWGVQLLFEPGRVIAGNAGILVSRIVIVKKGEARQFVVLDAAMNDLIRPALYDAYHEIEAVVPRTGQEVSTFVGPVCETGDTFAEDRETAPMQEGDLVILRTAGAYGATMASTYNSRALVPEVLVDGSRFAVVRRRQTLADMLGLEKLPDWLEDGR